MNFQISNPNYKIQINILTTILKSKIVILSRTPIIIKLNKYNLTCVSL